MYLSLFLVIGSFCLLKGAINKSSIFKSYLISFLFFLNTFLLSVYFFMHFLSGDGINDAIIFHLKFGIKGFGIDEYIIPFSALVLINILIFSLFKLFIKNLTSNSTFLNLNKFFPILIFLLSIFSNPFYKDTFMLMNFNSANHNIDENFFYEQEIFFNKEKKNIIFIYLEQIERTYLNEEIFPNLMPNIKKLEEQSISFTNIDSPRATNWTIAGMAASQCGVPLLTPIASENSMSGVDKFLPLANCIGDILNQENYELQYIGGSDLDFAGKGNFYKTHGFNIVEGWYELENTLKDKNYRSPWGVYDDELLDIVFKRVQNLHSQNKNFGLFTLTLDTHHPDGYISKSCSNNKYKNGDNPILNSVHCVDELVGKFMDKFLVSEMYENTTLVLLSDHLALKNSASDILNKQKRKNLFMIFDKSAKSKSIDAVGNTFDIGPTVMSFIGLNSNGLGLGRNLIINKSLSVENNLDDLIMSNKRKILDLWSFPKIKNGFRISEKDMKIFFGNRFIDFPALIILDIKNEVDQIMFDFYYANPLSNKVKRLKDKSNFLWIDQCSKIYEYKNLNKFHQINDYCILLEDNKSLRFEVMLLDSKNINNEYIKNYFSHE